MAHGDQREVRELRSRLRIAEVRAAAEIDKDLRLRTDPEQITRGRAIAIESGPIGAQHLNRNG